MTTDNELVTEQQRLKIQLEQHLQEWEEIKPTIKRLGQSEQDLNFLIAELSKQSSIETAPSNQQLSGDTLFVPPTASAEKKPTNKIEFGVHLASYQQQKNLVLGWYIYKQKYASLFKNKKAMMQLIDISGTEYRRLIVSPFNSSEKAQNICHKVQKEGGFCQVVSYEK